MDSFYIVDVFTKKKYAGNQLAVFFDGTFIDGAKCKKLLGRLILPRVLLLLLRH
jgi:predicted PhzF superfamily epimerase YddE/YHI9